MSVRRILVVGYPKSGNTWLTRLTAELLAAPVTGFWSEPGAVEIAVDGTWRNSSFEVYKGHQRLDDVRADFDLKDIVYVVRDVRDVVVSGAHYFSFRSRTLGGRLFDQAAQARQRLLERRYGARKLAVLRHFAGFRESHVRVIGRRDESRREDGDTQGSREFLTDR